MKQKRNYMAVILCSLLTVVLLLVAFGTPSFVNSIYDTRMLGQINTRKVAFNTYELAYEHFPEKLHAIGGMSDMVLENVRIIEESSSVSNEELTEIALREVQRLLNDGLGANVHFTEENLYLRKLCTVLGRDHANGENVLGARFYKLIYELGTDKDSEDIIYYDAEGGVMTTLTLYLDEEHHKLYAFVLENATWNQLGQVTERGLSVVPLLDYWEVEDYYEVVYLENTVSESWNENKRYHMELSGDTMFFGGDSAQLSLWSEMLLSLDKSHGNLRMGVSAEWLE